MLYLSSYVKKLMLHLSSRRYVPVVGRAVGRGWQGSRQARPNS